MRDAPTMLLDGVAFFGEPEAMSAAARVDSVVELERQIARLQARQLETLAVMAAAENDLDREWVKEEIRAALGLSAIAAADRLELARALADRLPAGLAALKAGDITLPMARCLAESTLVLDEAAVQQVEAAALAGDCTNAAAFRRRVRHLVLAADTRQAEQRHERARAERRVVFTPHDDGMTELWAMLPADGAARLRHRLDTAAEATADDPSDDRTADQRRADALCEVPGAPGPAVHVVVALSTLLGGDQPGELDGNAIPAALARAIADDPTGTWRRIVTDPVGQPVDHGRSTYRPPAALCRFVRARDRTCRFPGCQRRAARCELDHVRAWADGGATDAANLICLCRRHHHLKHEGQWRVRRERDGTVCWVSRAGHTYARQPDGYPAA